MWFTSTESFAKVLSKKNRTLLVVIVATQPGPRQELAGRTGRQVSRDSSGKSPENCPFQFRQANCGIEEEQKKLTKDQKIFDFC